MDPSGDKMLEEFLEVPTKCAQSCGGEYIKNTLFKLANLDRKAIWWDKQKADLPWGQMLQEVCEVVAKNVQSYHVVKDLPSLEGPCAFPALKDPQSALFMYQGPLYLLDSCHQSLFFFFGPLIRCRYNLGFFYIFSRVACLMDALRCV